MRHSQSGKEYAGALFALARESGREEAYGQSLRELCAAVEAEPDYAVLLSLPSLSGQERAALLGEAFEGRVPEEVLSAVQLLTEKGHIRALGEMTREYDALCRAFRSIVPAEAVSAVPLTGAQRERLREKLERLTGKRVELAFRVDPGILGGIRVNMPGHVLDGSLTGQMQKMKGAIRA